MDIGDKDQPSTSHEEEEEQQTGGLAFSPVGMALSMMEGVPIAATTVVHPMLPDIYGIHHYHRPPVLPPDISHQDIVTPAPQPPSFMSRRRPIYSLMTPRFAALAHDTQQRAMMQMVRRLGAHHQSMVARNMAYMQMRRDIGNYSVLPGQKKKITEVVEKPEGMKDDDEDESQWVSDLEDETEMTRGGSHKKGLSLLLRLEALVKESHNTPPTLVGEGGKVSKMTTHTGIRRKDKKGGLATAYSKYTGKEAQNKMMVSEMGQGDTDKILGLIRGGVSVNVKDNVGRTPLHVACSSGNVEGVRLLIHMGAEVNAVDNIGNTPLTIAATRASMEAIVPLLEGGADPRLGRGLVSAIGMVQSRLRMLRIQIRHSRSMEQVAAHSILDILPQIQERRKKTVAVALQCMDIIRLLQTYTQEHVEARNEIMSTIYEPPSQSTTVLSDQASQELDSLSEQLLTMGLDGGKKPDVEEGEEEEGSKTKGKGKGKMPENNVEAEEDQIDQLLERFSQLLGEEDEKATSS